MGDLGGGWSAPEPVVPRLGRVAAATNPRGDQCGHGVYGLHSRNVHATRRSSPRRARSLLPGCEVPHLGTVEEAVRVHIELPEELGSNHDAQYLSTMMTMLVTTIMIILSIICTIFITTTTTTTTTTVTVIVERTASQRPLTRPARPRPPQPAGPPQGKSAPGSDPPCSPAPSQQPSAQPMQHRTVDKPRQPTATVAAFTSRQDLPAASVRCDCTAAAPPGPEGSGIGGTWSSARFLAQQQQQQQQQRSLVPHWKCSSM